MADTTTARKVDYVGEQAIPLKRKRKMDAAQTIVPGAIVRNVAGWARGAGTPASTDKIYGWAQEGAVSVAQGDNDVECRLGVGSCLMGSAGDALTQADVGQNVYLIDNQTVGKTNGGGTRPVAGVLEAIVSAGSIVHVRLVG